MSQLAIAFFDNCEDEYPVGRYELVGDKLLETDRHTINHDFSEDWEAGCILLIPTTLTPYQFYRIQAILAAGQEIQKVEYADDSLTFLPKVTGVFVRHTEPAIGVVVSFINLEESN